MISEVFSQVASGIYVAETKEEDKVLRLIRSGISSDVSVLEYLRVNSNNIRCEDVNILCVSI